MATLRLCSHLERTESRCPGRELDVISSGGNNPRLPGPVLGCWLCWEKAQPFAGTDHGTSQKRPGHCLPQACRETNIQRRVLTSGAAATASEEARGAAQAQNHTPGRRHWGGEQSSPGKRLPCAPGPHWAANQPGCPFPGWNGVTVFTHATPGIKTARADRGAPSVKCSRLLLLCSWCELHRPHSQRCTGQEHWLYPSWGHRYRARQYNFYPDVLHSGTWVQRLQQENQSCCWSFQPT